MDENTRQLIKMLRNALVTASKYIPKRIVEVDGISIGYGCFEDGIVPNIDYEIVHSVLKATEDL